MNWTTLVAIVAALAWAVIVGLATPQAFSQVLINTVSPMMPNGQWAIAMAMLFADSPRGTVYKAGGIVRTARHVSDHTKVVGLPGAVFRALVTCSDIPTDSATLETDAPLFDFLVGPAPRVGDIVIASGFRAGQYPPVIASSRVSGVHEVLYAGEGPLENRIPIGPAFSFEFPANARGMSGGPVFSNNKVVGTIALTDDKQIFAVPLDAAKCPAR